MRKFKYSEGDVVGKCKKIASRIEMEEKYFDIGASRMEGV